MEVSRQEYWSGLSFPTPRDLPYPGTEPASPALARGFFTTEPSVKPDAQRGLSEQLILWLAYPKFTHNSSYTVHRLRSRQAPTTPLSKISGPLLWALILYSNKQTKSKGNETITKGPGDVQGMYFFQEQLFKHLHVPHPPPSSQSHELRCNHIKKKKCYFLIKYLSSVVCSSFVSLNEAYIHPGPDVCIHGSLRKEIAPSKNRIEIT